MLTTNNLTTQQVKDNGDNKIERAFSNISSIL